MTNSIGGYRWQPGAASAGSGTQRLAIGGGSAPSQAVTGGPSASQVLALNIPSRAAPNSPIPQALLQSPGSAGVAGSLPAFLNMLAQALKSPSPVSGVGATAGILGGGGGVDRQSAPSLVQDILAESGGSRSGGVAESVPPAPRFTPGVERGGGSVGGAPTAPLPIPGMSDASLQTLPQFPTFPQPRAGGGYLGTPDLSEYLDLSNRWQAALGGGRGF